MNTREKAHKLVDKLSEENLRSFVIMFGENSPFDIPNEETLEAFREVEEMKKHPEKYKSYSSVEELFDDLNSEE